MRYFLTTLLSLFCLAIYAQVDIPAGTPVVNGYDITYTNPNLNGETLYLCGNYGDQLFIVDSAIVKKGIAAFHNKKAVLPCGVYTLCKRPENHFMDGVNSFIAVVLNKSNKSSIVQKGSDFAYINSELAFSDSEESELLGRFFNRYFHSDAIANPQTSKAIIDDFVKTSPESFVSKFILASFGWYADNELRKTSCQDALMDVPYVDFSEPRLLYSPIPLFWTYKSIADCEIHDSDVLIQLADSILNRCSNELTRNYFVEQFFKLFDNHDPDQDPVLIHLYDSYDHSWIQEGSERRIERKIQNLRKITPGAQIPELISHDVDGKAHSTNDISTKYTVLWFWDPDCDHCQEMTPILHQMYQEHAEDWNFEVFAVEVNDDHDRWVAFSDLHQLWDWVNLSTSMGEANIDYIEYFDIVTTPVIFLVDNSHNHTIKARQVTLDELRYLLETDN